MDMKSKLGLLAGMMAMLAMDNGRTRYESDPLKRTFKKGDYVPPPKQKESKKAKKRRKLGKR